MKKETKMDESVNDLRKSLERSTRKPLFYEEEENVDETKENSSKAAMRESMKAEYNQRLLKSLERKTLKDNVAALSQPLYSKYR